MTIGCRDSEERRSKNGPSQFQTRANWFHLNLLELELSFSPSSVRENNGSRNKGTFELTEHRAKLHSMGPPQPPLAAPIPLNFGPMGEFGWRGDNNLSARLLCDDIDMTVPSMILQVPG